MKEPLTTAAMTRSPVVIREDVSHPRVLGCCRPATSLRVLWNAVCSFSNNQLYHLSQDGPVAHQFDYYLTELSTA
jgi:hypothetical protein